MIRTARLPRWAVSFADLVLLLLAFTVMVNMALHRSGQAAGVAVAAPLFKGAADQLFEQGEARLTPHARARIKAVALKSTGDKALTVESVGAGEGAARFDRWELAAARTAAVARALADDGIDQSRIEIALLTPSAEGKQTGQTIAVHRR